jgi:hypothetical protein
MWDGKAAADGSGAESVPSIAVSLLESGGTTTSIGAGSECVALDTELAIRWRETQLSRRARGKELQVPGVVSRSRCCRKWDDRDATESFDRLRPAGLGYGGGRVYA